MHFVGPPVGKLEFYFRPLRVGFAANKVAKEQVLSRVLMFHAVSAVPPALRTD